MQKIRRAEERDLERIAEIEAFCYRMNFYPIFRDDEFYFEELKVSNLMSRRRGELSAMWVYDDGAVKGFVQAEGREIRRLFVEPVLQGSGIGAALLEHAVGQGADNLWALEKNARAIAFYVRHGFCPTGEKRYEEDTEEYLIRLKRHLSTVKSPEEI